MIFCHLQLGDGIGSSIGLIGECFGGWDGIGRGPPNGWVFFIYLLSRWFLCSPSDLRFVFFPFCFPLSKLFCFSFDDYRQGESTISSREVCGTVADIKNQPFFPTRQQQGSCGDSHRGGRSFCFSPFGVIIPR